ncbi:hypothetical protein ULG90_08410 [Halopseudomonas pachastrellae]|nr:hypothetical protein ULG90_08410 [Halopseudomonas pachastrellae]
METLDWTDVQPGLKVTLCVGISQLNELETFSSAIARADGALYRGKAHGRNRVEQAEPGELDPVLVDQPA